MEILMNTVEAETQLGARLMLFFMNHPVVFVAGMLGFILGMVAITFVVCAHRRG